MIRNIQNASDVARAKSWRRRSGVLFGTPHPIPIGSSAAREANDGTVEREGPVPASPRALHRSNRGGGRHDERRGVRGGSSGRGVVHQHRTATPSPTGRPTPEGEAFAHQVIMAAYNSGFRPTIRDIHRRMLAEWDRSLGPPLSYEVCRRRIRGLRLRFVKSPRPLLGGGDDREAV